MIVPAKSTSPLAGKSIVTVEDESLNHLLKRILTRSGLCVVGQAYNGVEGIQMVQREHPDLVLMDVNMPQMDGLEATRRILQQCKTCVVMLTAYTDEQTQEEARQAGAQGYLLKPLVTEEFLPALERLYQEYSALD